MGKDIGDCKDIEVTIFNPMHYENPMIPKRMPLSTYYGGPGKILFNVPDYLMPFSNTIKITYTKEVVK